MMKTNTKTTAILACAATLLGGAFTAPAGDRQGILTSHVPVNDVLFYGYVMVPRLYLSDDSHYADSRWHRVPGMRFTVMRSVMARGDVKPHFVTQSWKVASVSRFPAEREPRWVWSRAHYVYVPYPVDYSTLNPEPERVHVGYTSIEPTGALPPPVPFMPFMPYRSFTSLPPIAEGPPPIVAPLR